MKAHRMDGVSLSFGLLFLLIAVWWAVSQVITLQLPAVGWIVAAGLIFFGVVGLLGALRSGRREVPAPVPATATVETIPGDLPPEMHAKIVQELLDDPADKFARENPGARPTVEQPAPAHRTPGQPAPSHSAPGRPVAERPAAGQPAPERSAPGSGSASDQPAADRPRED